MKVTSRKNIVFPKLNFGINKGCIRDLPKDEKMAKIILAHPVISEVKKDKVNNIIK